MKKRKTRKSQGFCHKETSRKPEEENASSRILILQGIQHRKSIEVIKGGGVTPDLMGLRDRGHEAPFQEHARTKGVSHNKTKEEEETH